MKYFLPAFLLVSFLLVLFPVQVLAQTYPSPSPSVLQSIMDWLSGKINPSLQKVNDASLPPLHYQKDIILSEKDTENGTGNILDSHIESAYLHKTAVSLRTPEQTSTSFTDTLKDFFDDIFGYGNKKAEEWIATELPRGMSETGSKAMVKALPILQCAHLPSGVGGCSETNSLIGEPVEISKAPEISPSPSLGQQYPAITPGTGCGGGNGGGYYDYSVGQCIIKQTGYCSVSCLAPFFGGDEGKAKKAAQICFRESGGNPFATNRGCLPPRPRSRDYSLGLFQINLLAHCSGALEDEWSTARMCTILDKSKLQSCENRFYDPVENIEYAVQLSRNGVRWTPWSAALPQYCNIQ